MNDEQETNQAEGAKDLKMDMSQYSVISTRSGASSP